MLLRHYNYVEALTAMYIFEVGMSFLVAKWPIWRKCICTISKVSSHYGIL